MRVVFSTTTIIIFISFIVVFHLSFVKSVINNDGKQDVITKLCGNSKCTEVLFSSKFIRDYNNTNDHIMLLGTVNSNVKIFAIKFSNRPDFFEAENDDKNRGLVYHSFIDLNPYVKFMEEALKNNLSLNVIEHPSGKSIREINSYPELLRDYSKNVKELDNYPIDKELFDKSISLGFLGEVNKEEKNEKVSSSVQENENKETPTIEIKKENDENVLGNTDGNIKIDEREDEQKKHDKDNLDEKLEKEPENETKLDETKGKKVFNGKLMFRRRMKMKTFQESQENVTNVLPILDNLPKKSEQSKDVSSDTQENEQKLVDENIQKNSEQKLNGEKTLEESQKEKNEDKKVEDFKQINDSINVIKEIKITQPQDQQQQQIPVSSASSTIPPLTQTTETIKSFSSPSETFVESDQPKFDENNVLNNSLPEEDSQSKVNQPLESVNISNSVEKEEVKLQTNIPIKIEEKPNEEVPILKKSFSESFEEKKKFNKKQKEETKSLEFNSQTINLNKIKPSSIDKIENNDNQNIINNNNKFISSSSSLPYYSTPILSSSSSTAPPPNIPSIEQPSSFTPSINEEQQPNPDIKNNIEENKLENKNNNIPYEQQNEQKILRSEENKGENLETSSDYCYKDDCKQLDNIPSDNLLTPVDSKIRKMFGYLPEPLCYFEDTGLIVIVFVVISILLHLTNMLFNKTIVPDVFDHRLLHDCITRLKEQEVIIEQMNANTAENEHLREIANNSEKLERENKILVERVKNGNDEVSDLRQENCDLRKNLMNLYHELEQNKNLIEELKNNLEIKENDLKRSETERHNKETELDKTISQLLQIQNKEKYLDEDLKEALIKIDKLKIELENIIIEFLLVFSFRTKLIVESGELDADNGAGSGGSAGWSDIGDGIEIAGGGGTDAELKSGEKTKKILKKKTNEEEIIKEEDVNKENKKEINNKDFKLIDILEMAKLKGKLRSLETEREQIKFSLKLEREEKENLQKELDRFKQEIVEKERDCEQRELDRHGLVQQCSKLLQMIEEKEKKLENSENEREKLHCRLSEIELNLRHLEDEKRELQHNFKELELSNKRINELNKGKLNLKIKQIEEQLINSKSSLNSPLNLSTVCGGGISSDLNMSGNSSDRDFVPLNEEEEVCGGVGQEEQNVINLWSEIETSEPVDELVNLERKASMRRRTSVRGGDNARESPFLGDIVNISSSGREERFNTSKYSSVSSNAAAPRQRMRSRSAGRQSARLTGVSVTNPLYTTTMSSFGASSTTSLNRQRASVLPTGKSSPYRNLIDRPASVRPRNTLYTSTTSGGATSGGAYSSDSNGVSSPPPEMPLLSGVPPPGLNKRPAILLPQKMQVQLHKPANILPK
ncbi:hypothetical protein Mgra_00007073 [Meloidogyne graminicola]|uniref:Uncharacterized protein n=1 Tax=Meloidogyne graminicola TaxID=189291 RepID=A0A8S9ZJG6_9BILA|nr:hypothetical protein Mgra_00007073 [Meloidogyne graminicola]